MTAAVRWSSRNDDTQYLNAETKGVPDEGAIAARQEVQLGIINGMKTGAQMDKRFQSEAGKYAAYLETSEGRLRLDLAFANLLEFLPDDMTSLRALDIGGGTGAIAVRLARLGIHVTVLDSSPEMLKLAEGAAIKSGVAEKIVMKHGKACQLESLFQSNSFDLAVCHNVLEYVDDSAVLLRGAARVLRNPQSIFSLLVRSQTGEVFKAAIQGGDLAAAESALTAEWGQESLYGGRVRLFTLDELRKTLHGSFRIVADRGVRVIADYLPPQVSRSEEYERIFELERKLGKRREFTAVARYTQLLACVSVPLKDGA
jgi:S-adenosylmethionine-dependent methyltransferase